MIPLRPNEGIDVDHEAFKITHELSHDYATEMIESLCERIRAETEAVVTKRCADIADRSMSTYQALKNDYDQGAFYTAETIRNCILKAAYESNDAGEKA